VFTPNLQLSTAKTIEFWPVPNLGS
jgi:hypothetical protein